MTDQPDTLGREVEDLVASAGKRPEREADHGGPKEAVRQAWREAIDQIDAPSPATEHQPPVPRWTRLAAAALAGVAMLSLFIRLFDGETVEPLIVTEILLGSPQVTTMIDGAATVHIGAAGIGPDSSITATDPVALQLADGGELRLAPGTALRLETENQWILERGKLYLDSKGTRAFGACVMYGDAPVHDPDRVIKGFCESCRTVIKAQSLEQLF